MRIGEIARGAGVGVETVRFYELKGLLARPPRPQTGGYRDYPSDTIRRIGFIRSAQHLGFSLTEIAELLELEAGSATRCADVRRCAEAKRVEVEAKIEGLRRIRRALDVLIAACPGEGPTRSCTIIEAINSHVPCLEAIVEGDGHDRKNPQD